MIDDGLPTPSSREQQLLEERIVGEFYSDASADLLQQGLDDLELHRDDHIDYLLAGTCNCLQVYALSHRCVLQACHPSPLALWRLTPPDHGSATGYATPLPSLTAHCAPLTRLVQTPLPTFWTPANILTVCSTQLNLNLYTPCFRGFWGWPPTAPTLSYYVCSSGNPRYTGHQACPQHHQSPHVAVIFAQSLCLATTRWWHDHASRYADNACMWGFAWTLLRCQRSSITDAHTPRRRGNGCAGLLHSHCCCTHGWH